MARTTAVDGCDHAIAILRAAVVALLIIIPLAAWKAAELLALAARTFWR